MAGNSDSIAAQAGRPLLPVLQLNMSSFIVFDDCLLFEYPIFAKTNTMSEVNIYKYNQSGFCKCRDKCKRKHYHENCRNKIDCTSEIF